VSNPHKLQQAIIQRLMSVIDPETNIDVVRMRLVQELAVDVEGKVTYTFRPSSPTVPHRRAAGTLYSTGCCRSRRRYRPAYELNEIINTVFS
jgi:hypothetical protein